MLCYSDLQTPLLAVASVTHCICEVLGDLCHRIRPDELSTQFIDRKVRHNLDWSTQPVENTLDQALLGVWEAMIHDSQPFEEYITQWKVGFLPGRVHWSRRHTDHRLCISHHDLVVGITYTQPSWWQLRIAIWCVLLVRSSQVWTFLEQLRAER